MQPAKLVSGPLNHMRRCRHGYMVYNCNDMYIGRSLDLYGEWSEGELEVFRQIVRPGDTAVDAGANIGTHTIFLANAVGPQGKVYAFEPQRLVFQMLCANMALNSITNTRCLQVAVGPRAGTINVPILDFTKVNNFGGLSLGSNLPGEEVAVVPLDSLNLPACRLLKADVEGMELEFLRGATQTIDRHKPYLYLENDRMDLYDDLTKFVDSLGYEMYWHLPQLFNPNNFFGNQQNAFVNVVSANLLCVHKSWNVALKGFRRTYPGDKHPFSR